MAPSPEAVFVPEPRFSCGVGGPCLNGGEPMFIEINGNVSCVCNCTLAIGFDGDHCGIPRQICSSDGFYCANGGVCGAPSNLGGAFVCHCPIGYYGLQCKEKGVICTASLICKNGGTCNATAAGLPQCVCPAGFSGEDCGQDAMTPSGTGPASLFKGEGDKANPVGVAFGVIGGLLAVGLLAVGGVYCWRRVQKRRSPYSFDYLYNQQSAPMTGGAFSEVQMEDLNPEQEYRNGSNIHNTSLNY
ncbi:hypothetical protein KFL_000540400 [Klebsormidium nitens]|uniref:EGF-like domain-containing protein n=1 Tax=Klebsormidium nitens TaxID=105231 RepID=A0A0U9HRS6_KLENI|nr:hypothetical protein KFL_000540400 [Klebsormidium nitens]|eukprot:GAQ80465.1 hypothetical protein KFL_000540400 [Klebsormidium nitens]